MNSYKAYVEDIDPYNLDLDLTISMGFGLTLRKKLSLADIDIDFLHKNLNEIMYHMFNYIGENNNKIDIIVNEHEHIFVFNGVDSNHLNAVLVEKGYATYI